jgi:hypothetical protein
LGPRVVDVRQLPVAKEASKQAIHCRAIHLPR